MSCLQVREVGHLVCRSTNSGSLSAGLQSEAACWQRRFKHITGMQVVTARSTSYHGLVRLRMRHGESLNLDLLFTWEAFLPLSLSFLGFGRGIDALQKALFRQRRTREVLEDRPLKAGYGGTSL